MKRYPSQANPGHEQREGSGDTGAGGGGRQKAFFALGQVIKDERRWSYVDSRHCLLLDRCLFALGNNSGDKTSVSFLDQFPSKLNTNYCLNANDIP